MAHRRTPAAQQVREMYQRVIDDVIDRMRDAFIDEGSDERTLQELREVWMARLEEQAVHREQTNYGNAFSNPEMHSVVLGASASGTDGTPAKDGAAAVAVAADGAAAAQAPPSAAAPSANGSTTAAAAPAAAAAAAVPAAAGVDPAAAAAAAAENGDDVESKVSSDGDDDGDNDGDGGANGGGNDSETLSDLDSDEDEEDVEDIILCQYDKVSHNKNRWRVQLRAGVVKIDSVEYMFQKATGDYEW